LGIKLEHEAIGAASNIMNDFSLKLYENFSFNAEKFLKE
jgi:hypothetical protein